MDYKKLNEVLKNLDTLRYSKEALHKEVIKEVNGGYEELGEFYEVYDVGLQNGVFMKVQYLTDSYGDNERVGGVEFVKAKEKTVTAYAYE